MIDQHSEYAHGLASDMRRRHLPPSSSNSGWHFPPEKSPALEVVSAGIRVAPGLLFLAVVVAACAAVWVITP